MNNKHKPPLTEQSLEKILEIQCPEILDCCIKAKEQSKLGIVLNWKHFKMIYEDLSLLAMIVAYVTLSRNLELYFVDGNSENGSKYFKNSNQPFSLN